MNNLRNNCADELKRDTLYIEYNISSRLTKCDTVIDRAVSTHVESDPDHFVIHLSRQIVKYRFKAPVAIRFHVSFNPGILFVKHFHSEVERNRIISNRTAADDSFPQISTRISILSD